MADASSPSDPRRITHLLRAIGGDGEEHRAALAELMPLVYDNLRRMARRQLGREHRSYTLESMRKRAAFPLTPSVSPPRGP